jgi:hypothetical protein
MRIEAGFGPDLPEWQRPALAAVTDGPPLTAYQRPLARRIDTGHLDITLHTTFSPGTRALLGHPALAAVIVPSRAEPFGRISLEAYAAGASPVIATTAGGLAETVTEPLTGYTADPADPPSLAAAIVRALTADPEDHVRILTAADLASGVPGRRDGGKTDLAIPPPRKRPRAAGPLPGPKPALEHAGRMLRKTGPQTAGPRPRTPARLIRLAPQRAADPHRSRTRPQMTGRPGHNAGTDAGRVPGRDQPAALPLGQAPGPELAGTSWLTGSCAGQCHITYSANQDSGEP